MGILKLLLAVLLLAAAGAGYEYLTLRRRADALCHSVHALSMHAAAVSTWIRESEADPFLGENALRGPPQGVIATYRQRLRRLSTDWSARFLPAAAVQAIQRVGFENAEGATRLRALAALVPVTKALPCRAEGAPANDSLAADVEAANHFWSDRKAAAGQDKLQFARDQVIFCHAEGLLAKLRGMVKASDEACQRAKAGSKLEKSCRAGRPASTVSVEREIRDLEEERELNRRKLREKWPEAVVEGLRC
jgi:hypothetical protein